ncbi:hypothetical protein CC2G_002056 [Coprinopsis cinerea AmutBmut pab1-1]|nr:hypothetical protein CC2G_002056 [Coprinopsis cinerea AmutBmut pab1-1]
MYITSLARKSRREPANFGGMAAIICLDWGGRGAGRACGLETDVGPSRGAPLGTESGNTNGTAVGGLGTGALGLSSGVLRVVTSILARRAIMSVQWSLRQICTPDCFGLTSMIVTTDTTQPAVSSTFQKS